MSKFKYHGWGRGGMVGVRKAIWRHDQTIRQAETILAEEHGTRHKEGEHELCPKCREHASQNVQSDASQRTRIASTLPSTANPQRNAI